MPLTTSDYSYILKTDYHEPIVDQLENSTAFLSRMERYTEETGGNFFYRPVRSGRTSSVGARRDGANDTIPKGDKPSYNAATWTASSMYATLRVTGRAMRMSRNNSYAFAKAQVRDMEDTVTDLKKDVNRQLFADGSGELCQVNVTASVTTVTVSSNFYPTNPTKFLFAGMHIDIATITTGATITTDCVVQTVPNTSTFTISASTALTLGQAVYRQGSVDTSGSMEMYGLMAGANSVNPSAVQPTYTRLTGNYGGLNRTTYPFYAGQTMSNSGTLRPMSLNLFQQAIENAKLNAGADTSLIVTNYMIYRIYGVGLAATKNGMMDTMELDGGYTALNVNGLPLVPDTECPDYTVFFLDESTWALGITGPWEWIEDNGNVLTRLPQQDQYEAVLVRDIQLLCDKPKSNVILQDIAHS